MEQRGETNTESVVITGCGWVTPVAAGSIADVLAAAERSSRSTATAEAQYLPVANERMERFPNFPPEVTKEKGAWMTAVAIRVAMEHAFAHGQTGVAASDLLSKGGIEPQRAGLVLGCALAGQLGMIRFASDVREQSARFVSPINFPQTVGNYMAGAMARAFNLRGPNLTLAGETSGLDAIHEACAILRENRADIMIAGATDELTDALAAALGPERAVLSEAACWFILERKSTSTARRVAPLAHIRRLSRAHTTEGPSQPDAHAMVSAFGTPRPGAIFVEHWFGHSLAASGPAALAAAIGAAGGCRVPVADTSDPLVVRVTSLSPGRFASIVGIGEDRHYQLDIDELAQADGTNHSG